MNVANQELGWIWGSRRALALLLGSVAYFDGEQNLQV